MPVNAAGRTLWNDKTRSDLLQAIIDVAPPNSKEWETIIAQLHAKGYTYGFNAALQHLQKLKKKDGEAPSAPKKPPKTKKPTKRKQVPDEDEDEEKVVKKKLKLEVDTFDKYIDDEPDLDEDGEI
ncbi:hypothetical protein GGR58DRAFT_519478 [Xylaria digitata]|nr:hypothetical protein GGR58DRAFT_519478 [Xylaria digitata]